MKKPTSKNKRRCVQRALSAAAEAKKRDLQKLSGALLRVDVHITRQEEEALKLFSEGMEIGRFLECFAADLAGSERHIWPQCHHEAHNWLKAHDEGRALGCTGRSQHSDSGEGRDFSETGARNPSAGR